MCSRANVRLLFEVSVVVLTVGKALWLKIGNFELGFVMVLVG